MDISYHMDHMIHMDCYLDTSDGNMAYTRVDQHSAILFSDNGYLCVLHS